MSNRFSQFCILIFLLIGSSFVYANGQTSELNETMKKIGFSYKQIMKAKTTDEALNAISEMELLIEKSKVLGFKPELKDKSFEGLNQVKKQLDELIPMLMAGELDKAKEHALKIDALRKEYHKLHEPPSFWELLFGK
ncbi:cytochrome b562 [Pseudoalteromonas xiamenensis]